MFNKEIKINPVIKLFFVGLSVAMVIISIKLMDVKGFSFLMILIFCYLFSLGFNIVGYDNVIYDSLKESVLLFALGAIIAASFNILATTFIYFFFPEFLVDNITLKGTRVMFIYTLAFAFSGCSYTFIIKDRN